MLRDEARQVLDRQNRGFIDKYDLEHLLQDTFQLALPEAELRAVVDRMVEVAQDAASVRALPGRLSGLTLSVPQCFS